MAILLVLVCHVAGSLTFLAVGSAGVSVFFTLSGFLITSMLLEHRDVSLRQFYRNRALRLLPALVVLLVVMGTVQVAMGGQAASLILIALYVGNWGFMMGYWSDLLPHTWSLSIEEQFYVLWPIVLLAARRWRNGPLALVAVGIVGSTVLRFRLWDAVDLQRAYVGTDTQASTLLTGCLLALLAHRGLPSLRSRWVVPAALVILVSSMLVRSTHVAVVWVPTIVPLVTIAAIWASCGGGGTWLAGRVLGYLGRRSYALYLWHYPMITLAAHWWGTTGAKVAALACTFVVAEASWRFVESPFLRRKRAGISAPVTTATAAVTHDKLAETRVSMGPLGHAG